MIILTVLKLLKTLKQLYAAINLCITSQIKQILSNFILL